MNGASPGQNFTLESGGTMNWQFNVPNPGDTAQVEVWFDLNNNGVIDQGVDRLWQEFNQIDGDTQGQNGPPDVDGVADGSISLADFLLGMAPANYIFKATNNGVGQMVAGIVTPLTNVVYTISGKVTVPAGVDPSNIVVELNRNEKYMPFFWDALTDAQGNFTIKMTADTSGNPWTLELSAGQFEGFTVSPKAYDVIVDGNKSGMNFQFLGADAKVTGTLKDENGNPLPFITVTLQDVTNVNRHYVETDANGFFLFGLSSSELNGQNWFLESELNDGDTTSTFMEARIGLPNIIVKNDSINQNLIAYYADTTITGKVSFDGNSTNIPLILILASTDSTEAQTYSDTITGNYTLRVSSKIGSYKIFGINLPWEYDPITIQNVQPGATNVNLNFLLTDVKGDNEIIPKIFKLEQNFPNPFNPSTVIKFSIPTRQFVSLNVYNILGQKMAKVVNKEMNAGNYKVNFNAENLPSGLYIYRLKASNFVAAKKMMLLK